MHRIVGSPSKSRRKRDSFVLTDEWVVVRELGHGGFATVLEVYRIGDEAGQHCACKIMEVEPILTLLGLDYEGLRARCNFLTTTLDAPHVVKSYGFRMSETQLFVFFEMYRGGDLYSRVIDSPAGHLTEEQARRVTRRLLDALRYINDLHIIHRDIKPENLWFRGDDLEDFVLGDFGCALIDAREDQLYIGPAGSPGYIAPEAVGRQPYNRQVDVYSLGICVYEMLTGRSPFLSVETEQLLKEVIERSIPFPNRYWKSISRAAKDFVQHCVERDPHVRWSLDELQSHPWLSGDQQISTNPASNPMAIPISGSHPHLSDRGDLVPLVSDPIASLCTSHHSDGGLPQLVSESDGQLLLQPRRTTRIASNGLVRLHSVTSSTSSDSIPAVAAVDVP